MTFAKSILVVANVTAASDELCRTLVDRAAGAPNSFTLLVPATGTDVTAAQDRVVEAVRRLREAGLEAYGMVGNSDPVIAVSEAWDPRRFDEIIVSTLPIHLSRWLHIGLPERIFKLTGAPVTHVIAVPDARPQPPAAPSGLPEEAHPLGPLAVLAWGGHHEPGRGTRAQRSTARR
jgi:hypothetical protein